MTDRGKAKDQQTRELGEMRRRISELESSQDQLKHIEEALRDRERKYRELADLLPQVVFEMDGKGELTFASRRAFEAFGYSQEDFDRGVNALEMLIPEDRPRASENIQTVLSGEELGGVEYTALRKDGSTFPALVYSSPVFHENEPGGLRGLLIDISERKETEEAIKASEERYRLVVENANEIILVAQDGVLKLSNPKAVEVTGYSQEELASMPFADIIHHDDRQMVLERHERRLQGEEFFHVYPFRIVSKDGTLKWVEINAVGTMWEGRPATLNFMKDVTERVRAEQALQEAERRYRAIFDNRLLMVYVHDAQGVFIDANDSALERLGYIRAELGKLSLQEVLHPESFEKALQAVETIPAEGSMDQPLELRVVAKSGEELAIEVFASLVEFGEDPKAVLGVARDITERKLAEEALRESERKYRLVADTQTDVIWTMGMDLMHTYVSPSVTLLRGYSVEEAMAETVADFLTPASYEYAMKELAEELALEVRERTAPTRSHTLDLEMTCRDGSTVWTENIISGLRDTDGQLIGFVGVTRDITERRRAQEERARHTKRIEALHAVAHVVSQTLDMDELLDGALKNVVEVMDTDTAAIYLLDRAEKAIVLKAQRGMHEDAVRAVSPIPLGEEEFRNVLQWRDPLTPLSNIYHETTLNRIAEAVDKDRALSYATVPFWVRGEFQGILGVSSRSERDFGPDEIDLLQAIGNEIGVGIENARLLERTRELSITDELTRLHNRRHFYQMLDMEMSRTQRYGRPFSLVMLDLDGFKQFNDNFGHTMGDNALQSFAQTLRSGLRKSDMPFRYGGDEFAVIMPATDAETAGGIVNRIRSRWLRLPKAEPLILESPIGFSAGIAQFPEDAETADSLVLLADIALYSSKRDGGYRSTMACELGPPGSEVGRSQVT